MNRLNRHQRRRAAKLAADQWLSKMQQLQDAARVSSTTWALQLNFYHLHQIASDPEVAAAFVHWTEHIPINRPLCLTCSRCEWLSWWDGLHRPPAGIVIVKPWRGAGDVKIICAGCDDCLGRPQLREKTRT